MSPKEQLLNLLKDRSFKTGTFQLASGGTSSYYIDGKMTEVYSMGAYLIGEVLYDYIEKYNVNAIGGLEAGAIPLTTAAVIACHHRGREIEGFWVRDEVKAHGTKKLIEGNLSPSARVLVIDDVVTKGGSVLKAIHAVRERGCDIATVLCLVDRLKGAGDLIQQSGVSYESVFTVEDLGVTSHDSRIAESLI